MTVTRRTFGVASLAAASLVAAPRLARAQKLTIKVGGNLSTQHPAMLAMDRACARIRSESKGEVDVQFFSNNLLGSEPSMHSQLRSGALEMMTASGLVLQPLVPKAGVTGMAFAFPDYRCVWAALDGDLGADIRADMERFGIYGFPKCMDNGFRHITSGTRPIEKVDDLAGLKIRVPPSPVWVTLFSGLKAAPTTVNFNELYTALQTKVVDAQENPLVLIEAAKLFEVQKYCALTGHLWDGCWPIANAKLWKATPADARDLISRVFDEESVKQREESERLNVELKADLARKGMVFNTPDPKPFREALSRAAFYAEWKKRYGPQLWEILERYTGPLA